MEIPSPRFTRSAHTLFLLIVKHRLESLPVFWECPISRNEITKLSRSDNVIKLLDSFNYGAYVEGIVFLIRLFSVAEFFQPFTSRPRRGREPVALQRKQSSMRFRV